MNEERIRTAQHELRIFPCEGAKQWGVWLEPNDGEFDGVCIGGGETRDAAIKDAAACLLDAAAKLIPITPPSAGPFDETDDGGDMVLRGDAQIESLTEVDNEE